MIFERGAYFWLDEIPVVENASLPVLDDGHGVSGPNDSNNFAQ